jgi:hypothetical protein
MKYVDHKAGLPAIPGVYSGARFSFANFYKEKGMVFTDGVNPRDPALATGRQGHYHLNYQDKTITFGVRKEGKFWPGRYDSSGKIFTPVEDIGMGTMNSPGKSR